MVRGLAVLAEFGIYIAIFGYIFSTALLQIGVYLAVVSWMIMRLVLKENPIPTTPVCRSILLILAILLISVLTNSFYSEGLQGLHKWLRGVLLFGVAYQLFQSEKFERKVIFCFLLTYVVACADGLWQYQFGRDILRNYPIGYADTVKRVTSSFGYFGMFASYLLMVTPICAIAINQMKNKRVQVISFVFVFGIGLLNLFLTRTRGAWLSAIAMIVLYLLTRKKVKMILLVLIIFGFFILLLPKDLIFHSREASGIDKTTNHRIHLWTEALNIIKARPVFGSGLNAYVKNIEKYNPPHEGEVRNYYAHNGYLQHTAETGLVGLVALIGLIFQSLRVALRKTTIWSIPFDKMMLLISISGFLFYMFFDTIFHNMQPFILFWLLLGWVLAPKKHLQA